MNLNREYVCGQVLLVKEKREGEKKEEGRKKMKSGVGERTGCGVLKEKIRKLNTKEKIDSSSFTSNYITLYYTI